MHRTPLLFLALALSACGGDADGPAPDTRPGLVRRLALEPGAAPGARAEARTVQRWDIPGELPEDWSVLSAESAEVQVLAGPPGQEPVRALVLRGRNRTQLRFAGRGAGPVHQVLVTASVRGIADFTLHARVVGGRFIKARPKQVRADGEWLTLVFDLPDPLTAGERLREVGIDIFRNKNSVAIASVATIDRPLATMLPGPGEQPVTTLFGEFARPAVGLAPDAPLVARTTAAGSEVLEVAYALPPYARSAAQQAELVVTVAGSRGSLRVSRFPASAGGPRTEHADPWQLASLPLGPFAGEEVGITFEVVGSPLLALGEPRVRAERSDVPSAVLITSDTHRADHLGIAPRGAGVQTPFLDGLAARGLYFTDCWTSSNVTNPSHAALMTATSPRDTGVIDNASPLSLRADTLAERFRDAGYVTWAAVATAHLAPDRSGLGQGFDRVFAPLEAQVDSEVPLAVLADWLAEEQGAPLFVWLHIFDAHGPYLPPEDLTRLYYDLSRNDPYDAAKPELPESQQARWDAAIRDHEFLRAAYKAEVTYLDRQLERVLEHPRLSRGVIAFTSDHGESLGLHDAYYKHDGLYPETLSVPMILVWPGGPAGAICARPVRQIDLGRTLLNLARLAADGFPGEDLVALARADAAPTRPRFALSDHALSASVQVGRWFLQLHLRSYASPGKTREIQGHSVELYDLAQDPQCLVDLARERHEEAAQLRRALIAWLLEAPEERLAESSAEQDLADLEDLAGLGYASAVSTPRGGRWFDPNCECERCAEFE
jgi:arylsulfatase A-like enzyme